jgi:spore maturation protein CgeB
MRAKWYLHALPHYNVVFTPRRSNIEDMLQLGCREVRYLPFGYDEFLFDSSLGRATAESPPEVLFVGGADRDRIAFMNEFVGDGPIVSLVGGYWPKDRGLRKYALGFKGPAELFALTKAAAVNLILVRRANRDGHVMRTFEAGAIGGCLAVEDTAEHREIFGSEGETVRYFRTPSEAAVLCRTLIGNSAERLRLSAAVKTRIREGANTYSDRLRTMFAIAAEIRCGGHRRCGATSE